MSVFPEATYMTYFNCYFFSLETVENYVISTNADDNFSRECWEQKCKHYELPVFPSLVAIPSPKEHTI